MKTEEQFLQVVLMKKKQRFILAPPMLKHREVLKELYSMFLDSYNSDKRIEVLGASSDCQFEKLSVNLERLLNTGNIYIYSCYFEHDNYEVQ